MPSFAIQGKKICLGYTKNGGSSAKHLKEEIASLRDQQHIVIAAIDRLFHWF